MKAETFLMIKNAKILTHIRISISQAVNRTPIYYPGGAYYQDYVGVGWTAANYIIEQAEENNNIDELIDNIDDNLMVKKWLRKYFNNIYSLIPPKRKDKFVKGFLERAEELDVY